VIITFLDISSKIEILKQYERLKLNHETVIFALSHDLKGPINNINGLLELLRNVPDGDKKESELLMESLSVSVGKLKRTLEDFTKSVKFNSAFPECIERVDIQQIVEDVRVGLSDKIVGSKAKIHTDYQVAEFIYSRKNIRSIVYNLLSNAIKFSEQKGNPEIWIKTQCQGDYILLTVRDNGLGIAKEFHDMIFLQRTRLNPEVEGSGAGLFILKRMVEDLDGKVEVESTPGEGSLFRVYMKKDPAA
jgi:two-component system, OmpR family, phosphate regulon sensor histidine kinase PhoR